MKYTGIIHKMRTVDSNPVQYFLTLGETEISMNQLLSKNIEINFTGKINCIRCGRRIYKSFAQGYCFPCFQSSPETEECVLRPELCKAHEGIARDMEFAKEHCLIDHFVYLSYTSNIKVGVTRHTQIPTRWIDQGAIAAIKIACTPNRYISGIIEVSLKNIFADKTNWRSMLRQPEENVNLIDAKNEAITSLPENLKQYVLSNNEVTYIYYPSNCIIDKISSINLDKTNYISDILIGIKGQYLIFKSGSVINVRNYGGYNIELTV